MDALINESAKICIFMATYNGAKYISEQLKSIENQTVKCWELVISDDGSADDTLSIIQNFKKITLKILSRSFMDRELGMRIIF